MGKTLADSIVDFFTSANDETAKDELRSLGMLEDPATFNDALGTFMAAVGGHSKLRATLVNCRNRAIRTPEQIEATNNTHFLFIELAKYLEIKIVGRSPRIRDRKKGTSQDERQQDDCQGFRI